MSPFLVFTLKTDHNENALSSDLRVFISVLKELRFHNGAM